MPKSLVRAFILGGALCATAGSRLAVAAPAASAAAPATAAASAAQPAPTPAAPAAGAAEPATPGTAAPAAEAGSAGTESPSADAAATGASTTETESPVVETGSGSGLFESGGDTPTEGSSGAAAAAAAFQLNGYARGDAFVGKVSGEAKGMAKATYGELSLTLRTPRTEHGDGFAEARVLYGLMGEDQGGQVNLREAYVNSYLGPVDLRLGQQIIVWGRADALNPTNNLTPVDFRIRSPLEDDIRLGNFAARANLRLAPLPMRLEGIWIPVYRATLLPEIGLPKYVYYGAQVPVAPELTNGLLAGRLHLETAAFEASVSYLHGYAPLPGLTMTGLTFDPVNPSIIVSRKAYKQQVIGFDFSTAIGSLLTLRGEAAYRRPYGWDNPDDLAHTVANPDVQYVLGADHSFGALSVIAQYMGRYVFDWVERPGSGMANATDGLPGLDASSTAFVTGIASDILAQKNQILFSQTKQVQHLASVRLEWTGAHDALSISLLSLYNFSTQELLAAPRIGYRMTDSLTAYVGGQIFRGSENTLFDLISAELSAGYVELRATF